MKALRLVVIANDRRLASRLLMAADNLATNEDRVLELDILFFHMIGHLKNRVRE